MKSRATPRRAALRIFRAPFAHPVAHPVSRPSAETVSQVLTPPPTINTVHSKKTMHARPLLIAIMVV